RNLPRAIIVSVSSVIVIYALTNIGYLSVMTTTELLDADAVAVLWGDRVLRGASVIIPLSVMVSTFGSTNGTAYAGGRSVFAAARDGNFPEVFSLITVKQMTPLPSMVFTICLAIVFVLLGDIASLINFFSFTAWLFYGATFASLVVFRFKYKDTPRPYKVPIIIPIIMILFSIYLVIAPIVQDPSLEFLYAAIFVVGGLVFYLPFVHYKLKLPYFDEITLFIQLVFGASPASKYND
ncbi:b(0,+)-type amino acid transporter 1, partial [Aplysia californica]|uniref:B(0,+)-type amino acid transporter 1 n=1 Tax=Aplysia californica TaxID=6500 RepID=A0ABM1A789_APLCA